MILFAIYPIANSPDGQTYAPTLALARPIAQGLAAQGQKATIARVTVGPLTKGLLVSMLNHTGWARKQQDVEVYVPIVPENYMPPFTWKRETVT